MPQSKTLSDLRTPRAVADAFTDDLVAMDPGVAASLGVNPEDDRQPDLSPEGFAARTELARRYLAELDRLDPAALADPAERTCARLFRERITAQLALDEAGEHLHSLNNIASPVHGTRMIFDLRPAETEHDWALNAARMRGIPDALRGYRATLAEGRRRGLLAAPRQVAAVVEQLDAWLGQDGSAQPDWFAGFAARGPEPLRGELDAAAGSAAAAVAEFRDWLRADYAPAAEGTPDAVGRERYQRCARAHTGADLDLDEAYAWAWTEFHRLHGEMREAAERVLPGSGADPLAAVEHLERHGHAVDGVPEIRQWLQGIMEQAIEALDGSHFDIAGPLRRVESMIAPPGSAAAPYYIAPSLDFSRPGRTWLPTLDRERFPTWQLVSTWYHEGVPGHHLQLAQWVACAPQLSTYQVTLGEVSANVEGWALYAERLMDELGFFTDPANRLGFLDEQMLRTIRVIIDIGMHLGLPIPADSPFHPGERWTPELGNAFFAAYNGCPPAMRESEIIRYLGWPGQAIGYKLGERVWRTGRDAARRAHGASFDLKSWHMKALSLGSLGLDDLGETLAAL